uniref:Uncharacterized protein n=1 Tax=Oryza meridionalis TaxID=40149 RepID=A0A0E0BXV9_9ORYZ
MAIASGAAFSAFAGGGEAVRRGVRVGRRRGEEARPNPMAAAEQRGGGGGKRFGVLTEEKARQLRARMMETESFHDCMYHSAIASRLASAAPGGDDGKH